MRRGNKTMDGCLLSPEEAWKLPKPVNRYCKWKKYIGKPDNGFQLYDSACGSSTEEYRIRILRQC